MEIRKADAKGRVTGFTPGTHYEVHDTPLGLVLKPVATIQEFSPAAKKILSDAFTPGTASEGVLS